MDGVAEVVQGQMGRGSRKVTPEQKWSESRELAQVRAVLTAEVFRGTGGPELTHHEGGVIAAHGCSPAQVMTG